MYQIVEGVCVHVYFLSKPFLFVLHLDLRDITACQISTVQQFLNILRLLFIIIVVVAPCIIIDSIELK